MKVTWGSQVKRKNNAKITRLNAKNNAGITRDTTVLYVFRIDLEQRKRFILFGFVPIDASVSLTMMKVVCVT
jgi:hypothetical protein